MLCTDKREGREGKRKGNYNGGKKGKEQQWGGKVGRGVGKREKNTVGKAREKRHRKGETEGREGQEIYETRKRGMGGRGQGRERRKGDRT